MANKQKDLAEGTLYFFTPRVLAATATIVHPLFKAWQALTITNIAIIPGIDVAGHATNRKNYNFINEGTDGTGTTDVGTYDLTVANALTAMVPTNLVTTNFNLAISEVLSLTIEQVSSGILVGESTIIVEWEAK